MAVGCLIPKTPVLGDCAAPFTAGDVVIVLQIAGGRMTLVDFRRKWGLYITPMQLQPACQLPS